MTDDLKTLRRERPLPPPLVDAVVAELHDHGLLGRRRSARRAAWRMAAAVALATSLAAVAFAAGRLTSAPPRYDYMFLLYDPPVAETLSADAQMARVDEYRKWLQAIRHTGVAMTGDELGPDRALLEGGRAVRRERAGGANGYFFIAAASETEALAVAQSCPHLRHGRTMEVRRLEHR
jgi:hypothetical protein